MDNKIIVREFDDFILERCANVVENLKNEFCVELMANS